MSAVRQKETYLAANYRPIAARRGNQRAVVAVMHTIVIAIRHVLHDHVTYQDLGAEHHI